MALLVVVALVVVGAAGLFSALRRPSGTPRIDFPEAAGTAADIRSAALESVRRGPLGESLAPGTRAGAARDLSDAPVIFLAAFVDPVRGRLLVSERIAVKNTSSVRLREVRLHVLAPLAHGSVTVLGTDVDEMGVTPRREGGGIVVPLRRPLEPGGQARVDLRLRLDVHRLAPVADLRSALTAEPDSTLRPQLSREGLLYLTDWYPRPLRLGPDGWEDEPVEPAATDSSGPASLVRLRLSFPRGWSLAAGGHAGEQWAEGSRTVAVQDLAGARALPIVLMRHAVKVTRHKGDFAVTGLALDTLRPAIGDAVSQALYAKAALSKSYESVRWRDSVVVALALRGTTEAIYADNVVLLEQGELSGGAPLLGPGSLQAGYREDLFAGVANEWWEAVDAVAHPALREALRQLGAADVWKSIAGPGAAEASLSQEWADKYRAARTGDTPDTVADRPADTFLRAGRGPFDMAVAKAGYLFVVLAERVGVGAAGRALRSLAADQGSGLDGVRIVKAYARASGRPPEDLAPLVRRWLIETHGDEDVGLRAAASPLGAFADMARAQADMPKGDTFPADPEDVAGYGPGW